jgi:hypothetical protein
MLTPIENVGLGDIIRLGLDTYDDCTVYRRNSDGSLQVIRPYVHTNDVETTAGLIPYIGFEDFSVCGAAVNVIRRNPDTLR